jgi:UDP-N-acetylmuramate--alanine ligase
VIAVVTNIDQDHMATYEGDFNKLKATFIEFLHHLPFYGLAVMCVDDPVIRELLPEVTRPVLTYGTAEDADFQLVDFQQAEGVSHFQVLDKKENQGFAITLNMPGEHNALNAIAALAIARNLGVSVDACQTALNKFSGIGRRFNIMGELLVNTNKVLLIDDYGHHPTELTATISATRASWPNRRIVMVFQPHRYSRTHDLFDDFVQVLSTVDVLVMLEVYPAGETLIAGADSKSLCRSIRLRGQVAPVFSESNDALFDILPSLLADNDVLLVMGAGDIGTTVRELEIKLGGQD